MLAYSSANSEACADDLGNVWKTVWPYLESTDSSTRKAAAETLDLLSKCITPSLVTSAINDVGQDDKTSGLGKIVAQITKALDSFGFARSISEVLSVISSLIDNLRYREGSRTSPTAAESLLLPLIRKVGDLRIQKGFEYKEAADATLSTAMRVVGPQVLLTALPLNLEPSDRYAALWLTILSSDHLS
jgi:ribosomal RNA-processing protein 12